MIAVRAARVEDAPRVAHLATELGYPAESAAARRRLERLAEDPASHVLVAEIDGRTAAWLHVAEMHTLESEPCAEIVGLVVDAALRSTGVGAALVEAAIAWAAGRGLSEIRVRSNVVRERAHRFYERQGFRVLKTQKVFTRPTRR